MGRECSVLTAVSSVNTGSLHLKDFHLSGPSRIKKEKKPKMPACVVKGCSPSTRTSTDTLHVFPTDRERIRLWLDASGQFTDNLEEAVERIFQAKKSDKYRMCSKHFEPYCFVYNPQTGKKKLTYFAVPTIFPIPGLTDDPVFPALSPAMKRKRTVPMVPVPTVLRPGDCCPTCCQVIPLPPSAQIDTSKTYAEKATEFNRFHGTLNKRIQSTPRTFSVKTQCSLLQRRRKQPLSRPIWRPPQITVLPVTGEKSTDTPKGPMGPTSSSPAEGGAIDSSEISTVTIKEEPEEFDVMSPEFSRPSPVSMAITAAAKEKPGFNKESRPVKMDYSAFRVPQGSDSDSSSEGDSEDSQAEEDAEEIFSSRKVNESIPSYVHPVKQRKFIVFESSLDDLILKVPCQSGNCKEPIRKIVKKKVGSFIAIDVECADRHYYRLWESQPTIDEKPLGNVILASAILASGNSLPKMKLFFHLTNILAMSENTFQKYQQNYVFPTIESFWESNRTECIEKIQEGPVCIAGDGRWDSTGAKAKHCVYSMLDTEYKKIVSFDIQQAEAGVSSFRSEKLACRNALDFLLQNEIDVKLLCTDRQGSIRKMMKEEYSTIAHELDVYHLVESVAQKLSAASHEKNCEDLAEWVRPIRNHLWWCSNTYTGDDDLLLDKWNSVLYHVQNIHVWVDKDSKYTSCQHEHLPEDVGMKRKWLNKNSASFGALKNIVLDKRLQKDIRQICHFCQSANIEVFHSAILKYQNPQQNITIDEMFARTQLAALDHNNNCGRILDTVRQASRIGFKMAYTKTRKERYVQEMYDPNNQEFLIDLMQEVVEFVAGNRIFEWCSRGSLLT